MKKLILICIVFALLRVNAYGQRFKSERECFTICLQYKINPGYCKLSKVECKSGENAVIKIDDGSKAAGAFLVLGPVSLDGKRSDTFVFEHIKRGTYRILNRYTRMYMTIKDGKDAPGTEIIQEPLRADSSQLFHVKRADPIKVTPTALGRERHNSLGTDQVTAYVITSLNGHKLGTWKATRNWGTHIRLTGNGEGYAPLWYLLPRAK